MSNFDITDRIGPLPELNREAAWPMYFFNRAAYVMWNAIASELHDAGWTDAQIQQWLQSKLSRWALDGKLGTAIAQTGRDYARGVILAGKG